MAGSDDSERQNQHLTIGLFAIEVPTLKTAMLPPSVSSVTKFYMAVGFVLRLCHTWTRL